MHHIQNTADSAKLPLTTEAFAQALSMKPQTLRKRYSKCGSYFGVRPIKFPNGRLYWPSDAIAQLQDGGAK